MNFNESITLKEYSDNANKQFGDMQSRLSQIENSFQTRMNGKTRGRLVGSLIGTLAWLAAFVACSVFVINMVDNTMLRIAVAVTLVIAIVLIVFMIIDNIMDFSYYGKISSYKNSISQLQNRIDIGKNSIKTNHDAFMSTRSKGWNYLLSAAPSISDEALSVEATMASMESLKKGFVSVAKNFFFYATVIAVTVVGCVALFPTGSSIIQEMTSGSFSRDTLMTFNVIALIITGISEIILSKRVWSITDCDVTNSTLFIVLLGPIAFLVLIVAVIGIIMLVMLVVSAVLAILAVVVGCAVALAYTSGG